MHSTSDFPNLLSNAVNKSLLDLYQQVESPLKQISRRNDRGDFKSGSIINLGQFPPLLEVLETGEVSYGSIGESAETWALKSYGRIFALSFKALTNDDLSGLGDWARMAAITSAQAESDLLFALLSANAYAGATMSDGAALFHTSHANLAGTPGDISITTLGAAVAGLRKQVGLGSTTPLGIVPAYMLVGPGKEMVAKQTLSSAVVPNTQSSANPWVGSIVVLIEPRYLARNDWSVWGSPSLWPCLEYGYLAGTGGPVVVTREGFENFGIECRVALHFGCGVVDFRGAQRNAGA